MKYSKGMKYSKVKDFFFSPFKKVISSLEVKKLTNTQLNEYVIKMSKVKDVKLLPINERKNYLIVRSRVLNECRKRGLLYYGKNI